MAELYEQPGRMTDEQLQEWARERQRDPNTPDAQEWLGRRQAGLEGDRAHAFAQDLQARAEGTAGPSFAEQQLQQQIGTASRGQIGAAQRVGGRFRAGAQRAGERSAGRIESAGQSAVAGLRQQEQQQAQQQLDQFMLGAEQNAANMALAREQMEFQRQQAEDAGNDSLWSGILGAVGAVGGFFATGMNPAGAAAGYSIGSGISDERLKTNVDRREGMEGAYQFLDALDGARYDLPATREQGSYGVMAQSAERTPMGRTFVEQTPQGVRTLNPGKGFNALLLAQKSLHERLKRLEGGE